MKWKRVIEFASGKPNQSIRRLISVLFYASTNVKPKSYGLAEEFPDSH
jgi:hypothetical protein